MQYITKYKKTTNFSTTLINYIFQFTIEKDEIMAFTILSNMLSYTNKEYKEEDEFAKEKLKRFIMNFKVSSQSINNIYFLNFSLLIPNDNIVDCDYLESAINLSLDSIYKPNITNNLFDNDYFEREKRSYIEYLLNGYKNINFLAEKNLLDLIDKDGIFNKLKYTDLDNIKDLTNTDLVNFYNKYIKNYKPKIFVNGNIDKEKIELILNNYFKDYKLKNNKILTNYNNYYISNGFNEYKDVCNFYTSVIYMVYTIKDYSEKDFIILYLINLLLSSSSSDLLLQKLRKENNLVYTTSSSILLKNGLLVIKATSNNKNIEIIKLVIKDLIESFKDMNKYKENVFNIMNKLSLNIERSKDNFFDISSNLINKYYKSDITLEEEFNLLNELEKEDIEAFASRILLDTIYVLEGQSE